LTANEQQQKLCIMTRLKLRLAGSAVATAVMMLLGVAPAVSARTGNSAGPTTAFVDVAVATVWTSPGKPRKNIDAPALANPVNMAQWLANMNTQQRRHLTIRNATQTQTLYGRSVYILTKQRGWDEVAVPGQPTPKNPLGYPGWVPAGQLVQSPPTRRSSSGGHSRRRTPRRGPGSTTMPS
jgi:hypothetical protein